MQDYTVVDRTHSEGYAAFLAHNHAGSWIAQDEFGRWEVRKHRA